MTVYSVYIESRIVDALATLRRKDSSRLFAFFEKLRTDPFLIGDYIEHDEIGRPLPVCIVANYAIVFWADHAVKEVKVVDLQKSGS